MFHHFPSFLLCFHESEGTILHPCFSRHHALGLFLILLVPCCEFVLQRISWFLCSLSFDFSPRWWVPLLGRRNTGAWLFPRIMNFRKAQNIDQWVVRYSLRHKRQSWYSLTLRHLVTARKLPRIAGSKVLEVHRPLMWPQWRLPNSWTSRCPESQGVWKSGAHWLTMMMNLGLGKWGIWFSSLVIVLFLGRVVWEWKEAFYGKLKLWLCIQKHSLCSP